MRHIVAEVVRPRRIRMNPIGRRAQHLFNVPKHVASPKPSDNSMHQFVFTMSCINAKSHPRGWLFYLLQNAYSNILNAFWIKAMASRSSASVITKGGAKRMI